MMCEVVPLKELLLLLLLRWNRGGCCYHGADALPA